MASMQLQFLAEVHLMNRHYYLKYKHKTFIVVAGSNPGNNSIVNHK